MKKQNVLLIICFSAIAFAFSSCQKSMAENTQAILQTTPTVSPTVNSSSASTPNLDSPIRKVDFNNFTYPWTDDYSSKEEKIFTLKNGEIPFERESQMGVSLVKTEYFDVTSDKADEAILTFSIQTGGSAVPALIYIYKSENDNPKLLWSFATGDRAHGGLKKVYSEDSDLLVETFGDNKIINDKWKFDYPKGEFKGDCCPTAYTKVRFKWNGKKFLVQGKPELFDYDRNK